MLFITCQLEQQRKNGRTMNTTNEGLSTEEKIEQLEQENAYLRSLLEKNHIEIDNLPFFIHEESITELHIRFFYSYFRGRADVYAKRSGKPNPKTGKFVYYPQCANFWKEGLCPRKWGRNIRCQDCSNKHYIRLGEKVIKAHLLGEKEDCSDVIGIYPLHADGRCYFLVFDFDDHQALGNGWKEEVDALRKMCQLFDVPCLVERSRSGNGAHVWIFFATPVPAFKARKFGTLLLTKGSESIDLPSFSSYDRMLPAQDWLEKGKIGNLIALPLQGQALKKGNSAFVDEQWHPYPNQWRILKSTRKLNEEEIDQWIKEWDQEDVLGLFSDIKAGEDDKPWKKRTIEFNASDVDRPIHLVRAERLYVETTHIKPGMANQIRRLASFANKEFFKTQAMGRSTKNLSRIIACYDNYEQYIAIPRGLEENLIEKLDQAQIRYEIEDETKHGHPLAVCFQGTLYKNQQEALDRLCARPMGILSASTAFGKTVVGAAMIAKKKMSTLILVHTREILQGWVDALEQFLVWEDVLPQYTTPSGRKKTRKSHIGVLYGGKDTCSRKVDVAIISSVLNKEEKLPFLDEYGMVIMDECHHIPSKTYEQVIQKIPACCRYGFSATPKRKDGQDPKIFMYFGPVRYRFSAKERAIQQGIVHIVVPRYTSFFLWNEEQQTIQEAYRQTIHNQRRNELIIQDIKKCLKEKRTPLVLSRFRSHAQYLYRCLEGEADHVFLLQGGSSAQERETIRSGLKAVPEDESLILIAVDKYIGEGFNYPRLDTLFLATPFKSDINVEQYAGRLNRDHPNKEKVIIYDYVDHYVGYFRKMYHERIRAYKKIGYIVSSGMDESIQDGRSVYDQEGYVDMLRNDLEKARSDVVLCTTGMPADSFWMLLEELSERGVTITVFLKEKIIKKDFNCLKIIQRHDLDMNFSVIDQKIVWYGNIDLFENRQEGQMIRILDSRIADELMGRIRETDGEGEQLKLF